MSGEKLAVLAEERARRKGRVGGDGGTGGGRGGGESEREVGPEIRVVKNELNRVIDEANAALGARSGGLYRQGGRIVRVIWDAIKVSGGGDGNVLRLSTLGPDGIKGPLEEAAMFLKWNERAENWIACGVSSELARSFLDREEWDLPYLLGVVTAPTIRPDGTVLDQPGYDVATGLVFDPAGCVFPPIPSEPTRQEAEAALALLKEPIADVKFVEGANRAVALSGMITALIRRSLPAAPMHAFTAPTAGSGKSMLVDIAAILATGEEAAVTTTGHDRNGDTELEKRLTASLLAGDAILSLDNVEGTIGGEMLNVVLTQTRTRLRPLGGSKQVDTPIATAYFATSNNLTIVGDLTRRVLVAALDPGVERPELLKFSFNPKTMAKERRGALVAAALTIVRAWVVSGEAMRETPLGSFEEWSRLVREPLMWLGEEDPVSVMEEVRKGDPRIAKLRAVIDAWGRSFGEGSRSVAEVVASAGERLDGDSGWLRPELRDALLSVTAGGDAKAGVNPEKLSWWLRKNAGRFLDGCRFVREEGEKILRWRLDGAEALVPTSGRVAEEDIPF